MQLDAELLRKLGLTRERMLECDALFFYQLLLPIAHPAESGVKDDPRLPYYDIVARNTNLYAIGVKDRGGTRGHSFRPVISEELLVWDGIVARNISDNIAESWMMSQSNTFDRNISDAMHYRRWIDIKGCLKQNEYFSEKKRTDAEYDPTQKYRLVWDVMTHNMNQLIKKGGTDYTLDETSWQNASYADVHSRLLGKKCDKGGQHVLLLDSKRRYIYAWTPRHKFFPKTPPFTASGPAEVKRIVELIAPLVKGAAKDATDSRRQIFDEKGHIGMDNYFSGDAVLRYLGEDGWKSTMTCRRDRLPKEVNKKYFHFEKTTTVNHRSKVARFEQPIIAVKHVKQNKNSDKHDYTLCHVSFQSTGGTNISTVNALSSVDLYVRERKKGRGNQKRTWAIEMNEARETYLKTYSAVDKIDQMLLEWNLKYVTWKWWHAPLRHGKAIAMSMAYSLYKHCAEGDVDPEWKVPVISGPKFRQKMSLQMVQYKSHHMKYPGDEKMRSTTIKNQERRGDNLSSLTTCDDQVKRVSYAQYLDEKKPRGRKSRLCSDDLLLLKEHLNSMKKSHAAKCSMCGELTHMECQLCKKHICFKSGPKISSISCCLDYHNDHLYGLGFNDRVELYGIRQSQFRKATIAEVKRNKTHVQTLMMKYYDDMRKND